jgi:hypothetical protein
MSMRAGLAPEAVERPSIRKARSATSTAKGGVRPPSTTRAPPSSMMSWRSTIGVVGRPLPLPLDLDAVDV